MEKQEIIGYILDEYNWTIKWIGNRYYYSLEAFIRYDERIALMVERFEIKLEEIERYVGRDWS